MNHLFGNPRPLFEGPIVEMVRVKGCDHGEGVRHACDSKLHFRPLGGSPLLYTCGSGSKIGTQNRTLVKRTHGLEPAIFFLVVQF